MTIISSDAWKVWQNGRFQDDLTLGWGPLLSNLRGTLRMPVDHRFLMFPPCIGQVVEWICKHAEASLSG